MAAHAPRYDSYQVVADTLTQALSRAAAAAAGSIEAQRAARLAVVAFVDPWAPPAHATAVALEQVRMSGDVQAFAQLYLVDASAERDATWDSGVVTTPALLFYWDGAPVVVRRPTWEDDNKFTGACSAERLVEIIRHTRDCCFKCAEDHAELVVGLDF
jgi:hypothetical protein